MNAISEHDQKRADALRSLSIGSLQPPVALARRSRWRLWVPVGLLALLVAAALGSFASQPDVARRVDAVVTALVSTGKPPAAPEALAGPAGTASVPTVQLASGGEIAGSGFVVAPHSATIFSKYGGQITGIAVELGERVASGQVLIRLEDAGARFALEQARTSSHAARQLLAGRTIDLVQARTTLGRIEPLAASGVIALQGLEDARVAVARASNAVAQAEQGLAGADLAIRIAEEPVAALTVRAPFAGTVTRLDAHVGNTVLARADSVRDNQSLVEITDMADLVIDADVAETHIAALKPGLRGEAVLDGFADNPFAFKVLRLAPVASAEKGTIALRLAITDPPAGIRPNMAARIRIAYTHVQPGEATR